VCRSIKTLRQPDGMPQDEEIRAAALQFVRKISGCRKPSRANEAAFNAAIEDITTISATLLRSLVVPGKTPS